MLGSACPNPTTCNIPHKLISIYRHFSLAKTWCNIHTHTHTCKHSHNPSQTTPKLTKTCSLMASSDPQFYTDFKCSGETSSQFHGSSSCPDISALSNYVGDGFNSFNTSSNQESTFLPQVFGISDVFVPEYINHYQKRGVNNATQYFHGGDQEYYGYSPEIKPLFCQSSGEQSWVYMHVSTSYIISNGYKYGRKSNKIYLYEAGK